MLPQFGFADASRTRVHKTHGNSGLDKSEQSTGFIMIWRLKTVPVFWLLLLALRENLNIVSSKKSAAQISHTPDMFFTHYELRRSRRDFNAGDHCRLDIGADAKSCSKHNSSLISCTLILFKILF